MKKYQFLNAILAVCILIGTASCADDSSAVKTPETEKVSETVTTESAEEIPTYPAELSDFDGYEFRFMNVIDELWASEGSHNAGKIDFEKESGDIIDDAIYKMMRQTQEDLNITFAPIHKEDIFDLVTSLKRSVMAADDAYDAAYICTLNYAAGIESLYNLHEIDTLNLDAEWWNRSYIESMTVGNEYLFAISDHINRWSWQSLGCVLFNKDMMGRLDITPPYELVREGKWTYDAMYDMMKQAINLNGAADFSPVKGGPAVYGQAANHEESPLLILQGSGEFLVKKDAENMPVLVEDFTAFSAAYEKVAGMCSEKGSSVLINTAELVGDTIFSDGYALFNWEKADYALSYRNVDFEFGMAPLPKADETQSRYYSPVSQYSLLLGIPLSNTDPSRTGFILDYMTYLGYYQVDPIVWEAMCYKGVRDEDSIDMLEIIYNSMVVDIGFIWGITNETQMTAAKNAASGKEEVVSLLEKNMKKHAGNLKRVMKSLETE